ncbi:MAG: DUF3187 family protein [Nitrospinota bacterium]
MGVWAALFLAATVSGASAASLAMDPRVALRPAPVRNRKPPRPAKAADPREILGPLPIRNLQPLHLLFFEFIPERAYTLPKGRLQVQLDITETNTLLDDLEKEPSFKADIEMTRFLWRFQYGLTDKLTLALNAPLVFTHGPFLDAFIDGVERAVDRLRGDRGKETADQVQVSLVSGGITEISLTDGGVGVGDVSLEGKYQFLRETFWIPAASVRFAVKFPTGDFENLRGSEEFDGAVGLAVQKIWGLWSASVGGGATFPGNPFRSGALDPDPILYGHFSLERLITRRWSAVAQLKWTGGLMDLSREPRVRPLTDRSVEVHLGGKWAFAEGWLTQFGVVQDISDSAAVDADFTLFITVGARFDTK